MPYFLRWVLFLPRAFQTPARLEDILRPRRAERVLEIGPGVGIHALPIASSLAPDGIVAALDAQQDMIDNLMRRATRAGIRNISTARGDAQRLPYPDHSFDAAYLISVLGEVPDTAAALRELHRVLKPDGRLVIGEIVVDPDFIPLAVLKERSAPAGFVFEQKSGPSFAYFARFRPDRPMTVKAEAAGERA
jgi:ubiquinone/menaquinone biosynthesis C-methylase UbiE